MTELASFPGPFEKLDFSNEPGNEAGNGTCKLKASCLTIGRKKVLVEYRDL